MKTLSTRIVENFVGDSRAGLFQRKKTVGNYSYEEFTASYQWDEGNITYGHGQSEIKEVALLKSICETYERRAMKEYFSKNKVNAFESSDPFSCKSLRSSNGWAIHVDQQKAYSAALDEALERHILTFSYLHNGWRAFSKINELVIEETVYSSVISNFHCMGKRAGIIVANSKSVPGVSFGYFVDSAEAVLQSPKWLHALYEAKGILDSHQNLDEAPSKPSIIKQGILYYLHSDWVEPEFSARMESHLLPPVTPLVLESNFTDSANNELQVVAVRGGGLLPLIFPKFLDECGLAIFKSLMRRYELSSPQSEWMPIL